MSQLFLGLFSNSVWGNIKIHPFMNNRLSNVVFNVKKDPDFGRINTHPIDKDLYIRVGDTAVVNEISGGLI